MTKPASIDAYLKNVPEPAYSTLQTLRQTIRSIEPTAEESISYGMPAFRSNGKCFVIFSAFKDHCSYFPMGGAVITELKDDLKGYKTSKGTIWFPLDKPLPKPLVRKLVKTRLAHLGL